MFIYFTLQETCSHFKKTDTKAYLCFKNYSLSIFFFDSYTIFLFRFCTISTKIKFLKKI